MTDRLKFWLANQGQNWKKLSPRQRIDALLEMAYYDFRNPPVAF